MGKTTAEMKDLNTFLAANWDFRTVWTMPAGHYPCLRWEPPPTGAWMQRSRMKTARDQFAGGVIGDEILVFGGNDMSGRDLYSGEKYDVASDTWSAISDNIHEPGGVEEVSGIGFKGGFYVFGACHGYNYNERYDRVTDTWTTLARKPTTTAAAIPVLYEGEMYFFGGYRGNLLAGGTVEAYDVDRDTWRYVTAMPKALSSNAVAVDRNSAYIIGGYDEDAAAMNDEVMRYDFQTNTWIRNYCTAPPDAARVYSYATQTPVVNGKVYLLGGIRGNRERSWRVDTFTIFDLDSRSWESGPPLPEPRSCHLTVVAGDTLYVIGGDDGVTVTDTVFALRLPDSLTSQPGASGAKGTTRQTPRSGFSGGGTDHAAAGKGAIGN